SLTSYCPWPGPVPAAPSNRDYEGGFAAAMMLKDLKLAQDAAEITGAPTPLGGAAEALFSELVERGHGQKDFSFVLQVLRGAASVLVSRRPSVSINARGVTGFTRSASAPAAWASSA